MTEKEPRKRAPRVREKDARVIKSKQAIREALSELMEDTDYRKITVSAVSKRANVDRKTFYLHYATVDDVAEEIARDEANVIVEACEELFANPEESIDINAIFNRISVLIAPDLTHARRVARHISVEDVLEKLEEPLSEALLKSNFLQSKQVDGCLPYCVTFLSGGLVSAYRHWLLSDSDVPLEEVANTIGKLMLCGVEGLPPAK